MCNSQSRIYLPNNFSWINNEIKSIKYNQAGLKKPQKSLPKKQQRNLVNFLK